MNIENNVEIKKLDNMGRGISYINDKIVFVNNALSNEVVNIRIIKEKKKYLIANVIEYIKQSKDRISVNCPYYNKCGGCNLQHIDYEYYINYKINNFKNIVKKYSNIDVDPIFIKNQNMFNYRNKVSLKIINNEWGYYDEISHNFIKIDQCLLVSNVINKVIENKNLFNIKNGNLIIRENYNNELLIIIYSDNAFISTHKLSELFNIRGIILNNKVIFGKSFFIEKVNCLSFKVNYNSFFQINRYILSKVFEILNKECSGKKLLDLYCGVGVLGLSLSSKFGKIVGIEINDSSIKDAEYNAKLNNCKNTKYYVGDTKNIIKDIDDKFDTIIIDPPRSGLDNDTLKYVMNSDCENLIYMSCDEVTLSRDLNLLKEKYSIKKVYLLDMFSNTKHIECISVLHRKSVEK